MKEFIDKLLARLEEATHRPNCSLYCGAERKCTGHEHKCGFDEMRKQAIEIVNELAEEYKDKTDDEWQIIYNKVCNLEKKYANDGNIESVNDCVKLENLLQYFKEELQAEEHNNDFCEWKVEDEEGFRNCRFTYQEIISDEVKGFAYCPYCGKKIKVV